MWVENDRRVALRILDLVEGAMRDPFCGIGKPEPLRHLAPNAWSRRVTQEHRLVYLVRADRIDFLQARYHYCALAEQADEAAVPDRAMAAALETPVVRIWRYPAARGADRTRADGGVAAAIRRRRRSRAGPIDRPGRVRCVRRTPGRGSASGW